MRRRVACSITGVLMMLGLAQPPAGAAVDATPPQVALAPAMFIKVGSVLGQDPLQSIPANVTWKASDPSGICQQEMSVVRYYTDGSDDGDDPGEVERPALTPSARQVTLQVGLAYYEYVVTLHVTDCAGNTTRSAWTYYPHVVEPEYVNPPYRTLTLSGGWSRSFCRCWTNGNVLTSSSRGARARYAVSFGTSSFALLGNRASNRGVVKIYVDGVFKRRVDLSGTTKNRLVVYHQRWGSYSDRVVEMEVVSGRVDIDGFLSID